MTFDVEAIQPCKYRGELYGEAIKFSNEKRHVSLHSKFHEPAYLDYNRVTGVSVVYDPKKWLLVVGCITVLVVVGVLLIFAYVHLPRWKMTINLKNSPPVKVRMRFSDALAGHLERYLDGFLPVELESIRNC
ncbi:MAG: hypothetical protein ACTSU5_01680 [Promethearchaeota archaeon]